MVIKEPEVAKRKKVPRRDLESLEKHLLKAGKIMKRNGLVLLCGAGVNVVRLDDYNSERRLSEIEDVVVLGICDSEFPSDGGDPW